jgi:hypothetical protein
VPSTVLITTATSPPEGMPFLQMTNVAARFITAKAAAFFWAAQGVEQLVIADATGSTLLKEDEVTLLSAMNVAVEQIHYQQDDALITSRGKGYAEGELIKFALNESDFLQNETSFFKCTGKVYCRNFAQIQQTIEAHRIRNIFWKHLGEGDITKPWADTRFFYTTKYFCEQYLLPAYMNADDHTSAAEYFVFNMLNETLPQSKTLRPLLSGFEGGTGHPYFDFSLGALDASCPCWLNTF